MLPARREVHGKMQFLQEEQPQPVHKHRPHETVQYEQRLFARVRGFDVLCERRQVLALEQDPVVEERVKDY